MEGNDVVLQEEEVFLTNVLESVLTYVLSKIIPPKCVAKELHRIYAKVLWNNKDKIGVSVGLYGTMCAYLRQKWAKDLYPNMIFLRLCILICAEVQYTKQFVNYFFYRINNVRNKFQNLFYVNEVLKYGKQ